MTRQGMQFEHVRLPVDALVPYERNARQHPERQVDTVAALIAEFGFTNPVLVDERHGVIAGHGRILAARKLGMEDVPCIVIPGLTDAQRRALVISDNQSAALSTWDDDLLRAELGELAGDGYDMALTGFDTGELDAAMNGWQPDFARTDKVTPELTVLEALVKVRCQSSDVGRVVQAIQGALRQAAIEGAKVVE